MQKFEGVHSSRFFADRISGTLLIAAISVNLLNLIILLPKLHPSDAPVPTRYTSLNLYGNLGPWYHPLLIAAFGLVVTFVNGLLGYQAFNRSRIASFFLLVGSVVVAVFCFIISNAFAAVG